MRLAVMFEYVKWLKANKDTLYKLSKQERQADSGQTEAPK